MGIRSSKPLSGLSTRLDTLTIFRRILTDPVVSKLQRLLWLADEGEDIREAVSAYGDFVASLYEVTPNLSDYIAKILVEDENFYIRRRAAGKGISPSVEDSLQEELRLLEELCALTPDRVKIAIGYDGFLPSWDNGNGCNLQERYESKLANLSQTGYGIFAKYTTFIVKNRQLEPVKYPDRQKLEDLYGYQREKDLVIRNTEALLSGEGASNVLLYGDAGTGKSSTIKAIANRYADRGLRLVEVKKSALRAACHHRRVIGKPPSLYIVYRRFEFLQERRQLFGLEGNPRRQRFRPRGQHGHLCHQQSATSVKGDGVPKRR